MVSVEALSGVSESCSLRIMYPKETFLTALLPMGIAWALSAGCIGGGGNLVRFWAVNLYKTFNDLKTVTNCWLPLWPTSHIPNPFYFCLPSNLEELKKNEEVCLLCCDIFVDPNSDFEFLSTGLQHPLIFLNVTHKYTCKYLYEGIYPRI